MKTIATILASALTMPALCETPETTVKSLYGHPMALKQANPNPLGSPGTGLFAPGKLYSFLGVYVPRTKTTSEDYSACIATTVGTYALTQNSWIAADALMGMSFKHNAADAGAAGSFNYSGGKIGTVTVGAKIGGTVLFTKGIKTGAGLLLGAFAQF